MRIKNFILMPLIALAIFGCKTESEDTTHVSQLGKAGVMPTIGKIYIENVEIGDSDGDLQDMRKAHLIYTLSGDLVVDDYSIVEGGGARCVWTSDSDDTKVRTEETMLAKNEETGVYECAPTTVEFVKQDNSNYEPDSVITISFLDKDGNEITQPGTGSVYTNTITLNTIDRHNLVNLATSPTTVLYHRKDGLFQSGYTAYRSLLGLEQYIGSAMYEARVKTPGGAYYTDSGNRYTDLYTDSVADDNDTIERWLNGESDLERIKSSSAFVSSYGPPIALPPFRQGDIDYTKLRTVLMRHNNNPIIISNDKKLYTMGTINRFTDKDLAENYIYHIKSNDNWFSYSGVDVSGDTASDRLHVGEIKIASGVEAKFVSTLSVTSDLGTIISLNETDKEYYIAGNPHFNKSFCTEGNDGERFNEETMGFDFNFSCTYNSSINVGAVKIPGLQRLIGDGNNAVATDNGVYYTGSDGKAYIVRYYEGHSNYYRIQEGKDVMPELLTWDYSEEDLARGADQLYPVEIGLPNMNPAIAPTMLMNDGSIAFPVRYYSYDNNTGTGEIAQRMWHFYINSSGEIDAEPGQEGNIRGVKLLGPTAVYAEDGNIYYFTDVAALGISYNPQIAGADDSATSDKDYLAFVFGDPVQLFDQVEIASEKEKFFTTRYGKLDINAALADLQDPDGDTEIGNNFMLLPYNPYTEAGETITVSDSVNVTTETIEYTAYRTNAHLFVNTSKDAKKNYIMVPYYFYGFDKSDNTQPVNWKYRENGLMAAEVRHNDVAKVFGTFTTPLVPFKFTPYGRNTAFFGNKKGIFSFINYNARMTASSLVTDNGSEAYVSELTAFNSSDNITSVTSLIDNNTPDYFYRAKVVNNVDNNSIMANIYEESSSRNNYIGNAFVNEIRMSNIPNNADYLTKGFEPQLLSSFISAESVEYPTTVNSVQASSALMPAYIPQYFYSVASTLSGVDLDFESADEFIANVYQYAYGVGMYRVYSIDAYPVWRARKFNTEILQMQTRFSTLMPMTHGPTASYLFNIYDELFNDGVNFNQSGYAEDDENEPYVAPRIYSLSMYTTYDADMLRQGADISKVILGGIDISNQNLGETIQKAAESDLDGKQGNQTAQGSGVGYILLDGNFMWRSGTTASNTTGAPVSATDPLNEYNYFLDFTAYHND